MRIVFMGNPEFAVPALEALAASPHDVIAVVSGADKKRGRGNTLSPTPVKAKALELGLPVLEWEGARFKQETTDLAAQLSALQPDLFVVVAFKILPSSLLEVPRIGSVNIHASLLPKYRGAAPIHHAVMQGETETGCTIFILDRGIDTGGIVAQEHIAIGPDETTGEVYERLCVLGAQMIVPAADLLESGSFTLQPQDDTKATAAPKLLPEHQIIRTNRDCQSVHNHIRGMNPFPGAWLYLDGQRFRILKTQLAADRNPGEGRLEITREGVFLGCASGSIALLEVQLQGRKAVAADAFFAGYRGDLRISSGD